MDTSAARVTICCCFNKFGDLERAMLRRGNHNSAKFWHRVLLPAIERDRDRDIPKYFRGDMAFAIPALYGIFWEAQPHCFQRKVS